MTTAQHSLRVTGRTSLGLYCARLRVSRRGGARPSVGPLPGLPVSQRPLQEDLSRFAENLPNLRFAKIPVVYKNNRGDTRGYTKPTYTICTG